MKKGHAGQMTIDTGTLLWLHAVHGVEPMAYARVYPMGDRHPSQWLESLLDEEDQE